MANVHDVANYLLDLSGREPERTPITQLQLQKLLYYVQGWSIAMRGNPMFDDPIEAWKHGPVVPSIYMEFKDNGCEPIPLQEKTINLAPDDRAVVDSIWKGYKQFSASGLRNMTHSEAPWIEARQGIAPEESCNEEISQRTMQTFFQTLYAKKAIRGLGLAELKEAERDFECGEGIAMEEVFS